MDYELAITHRKTFEAIEPSKIFKSCPECGSSNLEKMEDEIFCGYCNWDSVTIHADALFDAECALIRAIDQQGSSNKSRLARRA